MRMQSWCIALVAALILPLGVAQARECDGVSFPDRVTAAGHDLTLNGLGIRKATWLRIKVYVGALYLEHPSHDASTILALREPSEVVMHFVWRVTGGQLRDAWNEGFEQSGAPDLSRLRTRIAQFDSWMTGARSGDTMTFVLLPGHGVEYLFNGVPRGTIAGDDFAQAFLGIWLGPKPPGEALKAGLLGGVCQ